MKYVVKQIIVQHMDRGAIGSVAVFFLKPIGYREHRECIPSIETHSTHAGRGSIQLGLPQSGRDCDWTRRVTSVT